MDTRDLPMNPHLLTIMLRPDGRVFIEVYSRPQVGTWTLDGLPSVLSSFEDADALGRAALADLERSTWRVIPKPDSRNNPMVQEVLDWAGEKSWAGYTKGSKAVSVYAKYSVAPPRTIDLTPMERERSGAFSPIMEEAREGIPFESPAQIGRALQQALKVARA